MVGFSFVGWFWSANYLFGTCCFCLLCLLFCVCGLFIPYVITILFNSIISFVIFRYDFAIISLV